MKYFRFQLLFILVILSFQLNSQDTIAYFQIDSAFAGVPVDYKFVINGIDATKPNTTVGVPTNEVGFDTIKYSVNGIAVSESLMKLRPSLTYKLNFNTCSFYTIEPEKTPMQGMTHFTILGQTNKEYQVGIEYFRKLSRVQIDEFYYSPPSAMCLFASRLIEIKSQDEKILKAVRYHFLHGELIGVRYYSSTNEIEVNLFGHVRDKDDYRYDYDYYDH